MKGMACIGLVLLAGSLAALGEPITKIKINGKFGDWKNVPSHFDPEGDPHDTDHDGQNDTPALVNHPDVDLLEFKITHDKKNLYAYFRSKGIIGRTQGAAQGTPGRFYVIVTIDIDNKDSTGYWLHEGGYYPTSTGYDMNMECEFYNNSFNTGHYLNHGARNQTELDQAFIDQSNGFVRLLPGSYDFYSQWVWWDEPQGFPGEVTLPDGHSTVVWVEDKGPIYVGVIQIAISPDGHRAEMMAPFRGFMKRPNGKPIIKVGKTIDVSFSLEASGELAPGGEWASDTADPVKYKLDKN